MTSRYYRSIAAAGATGTSDIHSMLQVAVVRGAWCLVRGEAACWAPP
jgi:hypothetical protein